MINSIEKLVDFLKKSNQVLHPLTKGELSEIEKLCDKSLPLYYQVFLLEMGKGAGNFMKGSFVYFDDIFLLKGEAKGLLEENNMDKLPSDAFVFWMHQGYQLAYFILNESDNPSVYFYSEGSNNEFVKINSLLDFFKIQLEFSDLE